MAFNVSVDTSTISSLTEQFGPAKTAVLLQRAVSKTIKPTGIALIARRIGEQVNLKIGDIKKTIDSKLGSYKKPEGSITVSRTNLVWLSQFATQGQRVRTWMKLQAGTLKRRGGLKGGGVLVKVRKIATPLYPVAERHPSSFWQVVRPGTPIGIFERTGVKRPMKSGRHKGKVREVIHRQRGPTPLGVFLNAKGEAGAKTIIDEVCATLVDVLQKNLSSQVDRFLAKRANDPQQRLIDEASKALHL